MGTPTREIALVTNTETPRLIRIRQVMDATAMKKSAIYAAIAAGNFPRPVPIGTRMVAWSEAEVHAWIRERITASRGAAA